VSDTQLAVESCLKSGEKAIGELFTFVTFCEASIELSPFTAMAPELARDMTRRSGAQWGEGALERMEVGAHAVKRGLEDRPSLDTYLHGLAYVRLCTALETTVDGLLHAMLADKEAWPTYPGLSGLKPPRGMDAAQLLNLSKHEQVEFLARQIKLDHGTSLKEGVGRYEAVLQAVGLSGPVHKSIKAALFEMTEIRNAVVHRNGIVDRRLKERCPRLQCKVGQPLFIPKVDFAVVSSASIGYLLELWTRAKALFPALVIPHEEGFREKVLGDVGRYAVMRDSLASTDASTSSD
jgi:hypothetical protein